MATGGVLGNGTKIAYSAASPQVWTKVGQLREVTFPTFVADEVNIDTHSATNKLHRTMPGMIVVGAVQLVVLSDLNPSTSADQKALRDYNKDGTSLWWRIEAPVVREKNSWFGLEFKASVKSYQPQTPIADVQTTTMELLFDGDDIYWDGAVGAGEIS